MRLTDTLHIRKVVPFMPCDGWFKRNNLMKFAFFFKGRTASCPKLGVNRVVRAFQYMKDLREVRRKEIKSLWMERLEIASEQCGLPSAKALCEGLSQSNIALNKNMLQILSIYEPRTFSALVDLSKQYHLERSVLISNMSPPQKIVTRGLLTSPVVPGNRNLYE
ncbi:hypothetical protein MN116_003438 [Schistosoma mekongi]|uniref:50S ribosomal protein L20 n=1 Tax=Schistosoma mekongi TaxID=38744 RepID=A0AAE1ZHS8_SCHME|nr:hypothetical protein MN116_003438 [Schistosoma mekongi]